jgi:2'-5' RNA ligase superfamily
MTTELFVWLMPVPEDAAILEQRIEDCARVLGSPLFPPHLTLGTDPAVTRLAAVGPLSELPLGSSFAVLEFGDDYFQGCYLRAEEDAALRELQARCVATLGSAAPRAYPPHVSLAYGVLNAPERATAAALMTDLPVRIRFDRIELWESSGPVSSWRKLA